MRILKSMPEEEVNQYVRPTLRVDKPAANYARRSNPYAKNKDKDKSQSTEMLTDDLMKWAIVQGWIEDLLDPYYADLGLSGTLRPDQRPDMLRLFDNIDAGRYDHGSSICYQENRLFRDETQIYYNQFIDKCKQHDVVVVVVSPYLMIYDFRDDMLTEMFRWKCKESADFIKRHIKGWMLPARYRAAWHDGEWAGLGDPPTGFIVDFDEDSPTHKKLVAYWPHIEKAKEYFQLYMELAGDNSLLYRRLRESPIIFPEFEEWVDPRNVNRFKMAKYPGGGYYPKGKDTVVSMLTNPIYIGYRTVEGVIRRNSKGEKIIDHAPVIERDLFDFAYYRLAKVDLDGNPLEGKRPRRFFQQGSKGDYGLLKFRITSSQGEVRTHADGAYFGETSPGTGSYHIQTLERGSSLYHVITHAAIPCEELDTIIVNRLMEHVHEISRNHEDIAEYEQNAHKIREERLSKIRQIESSIQDIASKQAGLTISLGQVTKEIDEETDAEKKEIKERRKQLIIEQIDRLELERRKLIKTKSTLSEEAESDLDTLDRELEKLEARWPKYTFEKRRSLINFIVKDVVIDTVSTHWVRVQVLWLHEAWGREEMYWYRTKGRNVQWTEQEIAIVREHYAAMPRLQLMALLPHRGWHAIRGLGIRLKIARTTQGRPTRCEEIMKGLDICASYSDVEFVQDRGIPFDAQCTNWERRF
jgi:hypothetical protein